MKPISLLKRTAAIACLCIMPLAAQALSIGSALGEITPGTATNPTEDTAFVNSIVDRANGITPSPFDLAGYSYALINDPAAVLPLAVFVSTGAVGAGSPNTDPTVALNAGGYAYLLIKYGGATGTALVFDVSTLSGDVTVPRENAGGRVANNFSLFNATTGVPDGGSTVALMGAALVCLGWLRRKL